MKHRRFIKRCSSYSEYNDFNTGGGGEDLLRKKINSSQLKMKQASNLLNFYLKQGAIYDNIFIAAKDGDAEYLRTYFNLGGNVNQPDSSSRTCLHLACCNGHQDAAKTLIQLGADVNKQDANGNTPLHLAIICNHLSIVVLLLNNGAQTTYDTDKTGEGPKLASPLSMALVRIRMLKKQSKSLLVNQTNNLKQMEDILEILKFFTQLQQTNQSNENNENGDEDELSIINSLTKMTEKLSLTKQNMMNGNGDQSTDNLEEWEALLNETDELMNKINLN